MRIPRQFQTIVLLTLLTTGSNTVHGQEPETVPIELNIFPNPNRGTFYITMHSSEAYYAKLYALDGKLASTLYLQNGLNYISIDVPSGLYILKVGEEEEVSQHFKIEIK